MKNEDFTTKELSYIDELQSRADAAVANPSSQYYEKDESRRFTAARQLMAHWEEERAEKHRIEAIPSGK